jgi:hypothetical protein
MHRRPDKTNPRRGSLILGERGAAFALGTFTHVGKRAEALWRRTAARGRLTTMRIREDLAMCKIRISLLMLAALGLAIPAALAQRGMGDPTGVARSGERPAIVTLSGEVLEVKTEPCANSTGRSPAGTHFLLKAGHGKTLNIHLGPAAMVEFVAKDLVPGKAVKVDAFQTEKMPADHYVAQRLSYDGRSVSLRDETLQPVWARGAAPANADSGWTRGAGRGYGAGGGRGPGYGRNRGGGRGAGYGWRVGTAGQGGN